MRRPQNISITNAPNVGRVSRRPQHRFQLKTKPWQIQPMMIAPVVPGETMKNLLLQSRVVSDPVRHPLIGWWNEYYFFYVKHRDLNVRERLTSMMLDANADLADLNKPANSKLYHFGGTLPWMEWCLERIVEEYFRNEGETPAHFQIDGLPAAQIMDKSWLDSVIPDSAYDVPDIDLDLDGDGTITAGEFQEAMRNYEFMRANMLTDMSYEDFLRTYGVRTQRIELHRPELIRYVRDWTYPTNTVDPTTGTPTTAVVWSHTERADKDRFFTEPGFIVGLTVCRPKVYLRKQVGAAVGVMNNALTWLPAILRDDPNTSMAMVPTGSGPIPSAAEDYWIDVRDLLLYGDQFANFALDADGTSGVSLPTPQLQKMYATLADADALFSGENKSIRQDGIVTLNILGTQIDQTATLNAVPAG